MPETGSVLSGTQFVITTPISNLPTDSYRPRSDKADVEVVQKELPTPDTLEAYLGVFQKPYALSHFGVTAPEMPAYQGWADIIDTYVQNEMEQKNFKDSLSTYREIIDSVVGSLGLDHRVDGHTRMRKVALWIRDVLLPSQRIELKKQRILYGRRT